MEKLGKPYQMGLLVNGATAQIEDTATAMYRRDG